MLKSFFYAGTRFHLLRDTAHPALDLSPDGTVISIAEDREIAGFVSTFQAVNIFEVNEVITASFVAFARFGGKPSILHKNI